MLYQSLHRTVFDAISEEANRAVAEDAQIIIYRKMLTGFWKRRDRAMFRLTRQCYELRKEKILKPIIEPFWKEIEAKVVSTASHKSFTS